MYKVEIKTNKQTNSTVQHPESRVQTSGALVSCSGTCRRCIASLEVRKKRKRRINCASVGLGCFGGAQAKMLKMKAKYVLEQEKEQERTGLVLGVDKNKIMTFGVHNKLFFARYFFYRKLNFLYKFQIVMRNAYM